MNRFYLLLIAVAGFGIPNTLTAATETLHEFELNGFLVFALARAPTLTLVDQDELVLISAYDETCSYTVSNAPTLLDDDHWMGFHAYMEDSSGALALYVTAFFEETVEVNDDFVNLTPPTFEPPLHATIQTGEPVTKPRPCPHNLDIQLPGCEPCILNDDEIAYLFGLLEQLEQEGKAPQDPPTRGPHGHKTWAQDGGRRLNMVLS